MRDDAIVNSRLIRANVAGEIDMAFRSVLYLVLLSLGSALFAQDDSAPPAIERLEALTSSASKHFQENQFDKSAADIAEAQKLLEQILAESAKQYNRVRKAHRLLKEKGQQLPPLKELTALLEASARPTSTAPKTSTPAAKETSTAPVSFTKDVIPVLSKHCGNCHIRQSRGQFNASTYAILLKGTPMGQVVIPGKPDESILVSVIEEGQMPPKAKSFPEAELKTLRDWIAQGATFDGSDEHAKLPAGEPPSGPRR
jgi:mono/diheme cytochrome c family protein